MEDGQDNHSWRMGVVSHSYGEFGGVWIEVVFGRHTGQNQDWLVASREMTGHFLSAR